MYTKLSKLHNLTYLFNLLGTKYNIKKMALIITKINFNVKYIILFFFFFVIFGANYVRQFNLLF